MEKNFKENNPNKDLPSFKSSMKSRLKGIKVSSKQLKKKSKKAVNSKKKNKILSKKKSLEIFGKIKKWRKKHNKAPVDLLGAQHHSNKDLSENEQAFQFLVGVLLSVQTRDELTDRVMKSLLKDGITIQKYYKLTEKEIFEKIKNINFNKKKSKYIKEAVTKIVDEFDGEVPDTLKGLTSFKGIGNKVANIILQEAFGKNIGVAVDVHVHRISNRLKFADSKKPDGTMETLNDIFDEDMYREVNQVLVGFGQLCCSKKNPKCLECPVVDDCDIGKKEKERVLKTKKKVKLDEKKEDVVDIEDLMEEK